MKAGIIMVLAIMCSCALAFAYPSPVAADADTDLVQVLKGDVPGVNAQVTGSGLGYYGNSLRARFQNDTGQTITVHIPIGLRFVPKDVAVQTMYTAGGETVTVAPGSSEVVFKGFCGEAHDAGPGSEDVFDPDGSADGDLLRTLERINRSKAFDHDGQLAVWHHTNDYDNAGNQRANDLAGGDSVPSSRAAAGGLVGAAAAAGGAAAVLARKRARNTPTGRSPREDATTEEEPFDPEDFPDVDYGVSPRDENDLIVPDDYLETPPPDEDLFPPLEDEDQVPQPPPGGGHARTRTSPGRGRRREGRDHPRPRARLLRQMTFPPEKPDPSDVSAEAREKARNVFGAEGDANEALRQAKYPNPSTNPDDARQKQREIAEETVRQVDAEDSLELLRIMRALMQTTMTGIQKGERLFKWLEGALTGVYDKKLPTDVTEFSPEAMLSQHGVKGLYNEYRDTYKWYEWSTTPRNRLEVVEQYVKANGAAEVEMELGLVARGRPDRRQRPRL